jgi:hypothetical protein
MTTKQPPVPDPENTSGLEPGGGVNPGDTPPASSQESGAAHHQEAPNAATRRWPIGWLIAIAVVAALFAGMFVVMAFLRADLG